MKHYLDHYIQKFKDCKTEESKIQVIEKVYCAGLVNGHYDTKPNEAFSNGLMIL